MHGETVKVHTNFEIDSTGSVEGDTYIKTHYKVYGKVNRQSEKC
jgi:hypothetical protein